MNDKDLNINQKKGILLSRNTPVALVVGASSFLGSHLVDKLLDLGLQVVGVDDFISGNKINLEEAVKNKNFHLINDSVKNLDIELTRLDYLYIVSPRQLDIRPLFRLFKETKCRFLFVSTIELYDSKVPEDLRWFRETESALAKFAQDNNLNARILRLGSIFGPRMDFKIDDPITRLIQSSLLGNLQRESMALDFSSRALFVSDAVDLLIKSMLSGATALKIFDGVLPTPIKVVEIKQVLLDPLWYENRGFKPTDLPPWPTPNLEKTIKFLNWKPKVGMVQALRATLNYFRDREIKVPEVEENKKQVEDDKWKMEKREELEAFKGQEKIQTKPAKKGISLPKIPFPKSKILLLLTLILTFYALIWPIISISWGVLTFRAQLTQAAQSLSQGNFEASLRNVKAAKEAVERAKSIVDSMQAVRQAGFFKEQFELSDNLTSVATVSVDSAQSSVEGIRVLYQGLRAVTGELGEGAKDYFITSSIELNKAYERLAYAEALMGEEDFVQGMPGFLAGRVNSLKEKLAEYSDLVKKARSAATILPKIVAFEGSKNYLIILQNNMELRPTGGFIGSFAAVNFEGGKLKTLKVNDVYAIDGSLKIHVEPPREIKEDLGQKDWYLRDANWEPDFPTSAKQIEWFYTKETGERLNGVVALDVSAMESLLEVIGPLDLADYDETISSENLFERAIAHAEANFFPGSQAKKSFLTALTNQTFNKIFFSSGQNWPKIVSSLGQSLEDKHMMIFLDDQKLFSYVVSQNWAGALPRAAVDEKGTLSDLLAVVEANLGANKSNYYLERKYHLETIIGKDGEIRHRLKINYLNTSTANAWPAGKYKNRFRIYLPFGTKLERVLWGESDITDQVLSFVDYGRSAYSMLLELAPKEEKNLVLDYQLPNKLSFKDQVATYRLNIIKQPGTLKDPLEWKIVYPINYRLASQGSTVVSPQEQVFSSDLSKDRSFEVSLTK